MNAIESFVRQAYARPEHPALIVGEQSFSYGQLLAYAKGYAAQLTRAGVGRNDKVALVLNGASAQVILTLAVAYLGAVSVALPSGSRREGNDAIAQACGVSFLVHNLAEGCELNIAGMRAQMTVDSLTAAKRPDGPSPPLAQVEPEQIWRIGMSSGTTGTPKGIALSHQAAILKLNLTNVIYPAGPKERVLIGMGAGQSFAVSSWLRTLGGGGTVVFSRDGSPRAVSHDLREHRATSLVTTPAVALSLVELARRPGSPFAEPPVHLEHMFVGGGALSQSLQDALLRHVCAGLAVNYGVTEVGLIAMSDPALRAMYPGCAGRVVPWVEVQVLGENGEPVAEGEQGLLRMRSPIMASGYVQVASSAGAPEAFRDGWFHSNDVGRITRDGLIYLGGRGSDVLNLSGRKIDPARIEEVVGQHAGVIECAALALPGDMGQPVLVVVVVAPEGFDAQAIKQRCKEALGLVPAAVVRARRLPRNENGKIQREVLRRRIQSRRSGPPEPAEDTPPRLH